MNLDYLFSYELLNLKSIFPSLANFNKWYNDTEYANYMYIKYISSLTNKHYNVKSESEISYNPNNSFYFLGIKFNSLEYEMYRRCEVLTYRNPINVCQSKRLADLIFIKNKYNLDINIPYYKKNLYTTLCYNNTKKEYKKLYNKNISTESIEKFIKDTNKQKYKIQQIYTNEDLKCRFF